MYIKLTASTYLDNKQLLPLPSSFWAVRLYVEVLCYGRTLPLRGQIFGCFFGLLRMLYAILPTQLTHTYVSESVLWFFKTLPVFTLVPPTRELCWRIELQCQYWEFRHTIMISTSTYATTTKSVLFSLFWTMNDNVVAIKPQIANFL